MKNFISVLAIFFASFAFSLAQQSATPTQQSTSSALQLAGRYFIQCSLQLDYISSSYFPHTAQSQGEPNASITYYIDPSGGYYLSDRWAIGLGIWYSYSNNMNYNYSYNFGQPNLIGSTSTSSNTFTVAPFLQYSLPISDNVILNLKLTPSFSIGSNTTHHTSISNPLSSYETSSTTYRIGARINPGIQWFVNDKLAIVGSIGSLGYQHSKSEPTSLTSSSYEYNQSIDEFNLSLTNNLSLGVVFYWGGK